MKGLFIPEIEDAISRQALIERINHEEENFKSDHMESISSGDEDPFVDGVLSGIFSIRQMVKQAPFVTPQTRWIPCSERLPKINKVVLLSTNAGDVIIGHQEKPNLIWQVTENDGRKHWVYDPESYTDDVESLPKAEDCSFEQEGVYTDGLLSVTSPNYNERWGGVIAWMPLPEPFKAESEE